MEKTVWKVVPRNGRRSRNGDHRTKQDGDRCQKWREEVKIWREIVKYDDKGLEVRWRCVECGGM